MNLQIRKFESTIINFCNLSDLPVEVKRLVFKDILQKLETESDRIVNLEIAEQKKREAEERQRKEQTREDPGKNMEMEEKEDDTAQEESESDPGESAGANQCKPVRPR